MDNAQVLKLAIRAYIQAQHTLGHAAYEMQVASDACTVEERTRAMVEGLSENALGQSDIMPHPAESDHTEHDKRKILCHFCGLPQATEDDLHEHERTVHNEGWGYA